VLGTVADITERERSEELTRGQTRLLKMVARGAPLPEVLEALTRMIESTLTGCLPRFSCSTPMARSPLSGAILDPGQTSQ